MTSVINFVNNYGWSFCNASCLAYLENESPGIVKVELDWVGSAGNSAL